MLDPNMRSKNLFLALLLPLLLAAFSIPHVNATGQSAAVTPGFTKNLPPSTFTVAVTLAPASLMVGYHVTLNYNPSVLLALHVGQGNWAGGQGVLTFVNVTTQGSGTIEVGQAITAGGSATFSNSSLIVVTFQFTTFGSSPLTISNLIITGLVNGAVAITECFPQDSTCTAPSAAIHNGQAVTPPQVAAELIKKGVAPEFHKLSISKNGNVQMLQGLVTNTGPNPVYVTIDFTIVSDTGSTSFQSTGVFLIPLGLTASVGTSFSVPSLPVRYFVFANLMISGDNQFYIPSGSTDTLSYSVVP